MIGALAATTKLLAVGGPVRSLRFANRRTFTIEPDVTWLAKSKLTPNDRKQLVAILGSYEPRPPITLERALATAPEALFVDGLIGFGERPLEWLDVLDQDDVVQFQLWLHHAGAGVLLKAATTTAVARIARAVFDGKERGLDIATAERLAALLRKAKKIAANLYPGSALAATSF
jgi:hypothetical protein